MTREQVKRFRLSLEARRAELQRRLRRKRPIVAIEWRGDPLDRARALAERDFAVRAFETEAVLLGRIEAALREIREGTFGRCASCDREIPLKRLNAVPWSPYCLACQEQAEREEVAEEFEEPYALAS